MSAAMMAVLVVSFAIHAGLIATALLTDRPARPQPEKEIAVEIVHEAPPAAKAPPALKRPPAPTPEVAEKPARRTAVAPEPKPAPLPKASKPEPVKPAEPPKQRQAKPEQPTKPTPPREPIKAENPKAARVKIAERPAKAPPKATQADEKALAAMERELASLKAEQATLEQAQAAALEPPAAIGPRSFQAIALPSTSDSGEATGYESLVFSQLFKAKEAHRHEGLPGTANVVFKIDDAGRLVDVAIAMPSGIAALDAEALQVIREAAPFPPPPAGARHDFSANVSFVPGAHY